MDEFGFASGFERRFRGLNGIRRCFRRSIGSFEGLSFAAVILAFSLSLSLRSPPSWQFAICETIRSSFGESCLNVNRANQALQPTRMLVTFCAYAQPAPSHVWLISDVRQKMRFIASLILVSFISVAVLAAPRAHVEVSSSVEELLDTFGAAAVQHDGRLDFSLRPTTRWPAFGTFRFYLLRVLPLTVSASNVRREHSNGSACTIDKAASATAKFTISNADIANGYVSAVFGGSKVQDAAVYNQQSSRGTVLLSEGRNSARRRTSAHGRRNPISASLRKSVVTRLRFTQRRHPAGRAEL